MAARPGLELRPVLVLDSRYPFQRENAGMSLYQALRKAHKARFVERADLKIGAQSTQRDEVRFQFSPYGSDAIFRSNGQVFGWNIDNSGNMRDRDSSSSPDELHDSLGQMQRSSNPNATWEIAVPNGTYSVHLIAGDPLYFDSVYKINVEGVLGINGVPSATSHWLENTLQVTVTDGRLTISNAAGSSNNKIDEIDISQIS